MNLLNRINNEHIERLNSIQLAELLKLLLKFEAMKCEIPLSASFVPLNITVADEGEDGRLSWNELDNLLWFKKSNFIKAPLSVFQSKASEMPPEKCKLEVTEALRKTKRKGKNYNKCKSIKPAVKSTIDNKGSYTLFVNKSYTNSAIEHRFSKMREAFKDVGYRKYNNLYIIFLVA